jgi:hypothetical protein
MQSHLGEAKAYRRQTHMDPGPGQKLHNSVESGYSPVKTRRTLRRLLLVRQTNSGLKKDSWETEIRVGLQTVVSRCWWLLREIEITNDGAAGTPLPRKEGYAPPEGIESDLSAFGQ